MPAAVSEDRVRHFASSFERSVASRLRSRNAIFSIYCDLDIFRYLFGDRNDILLYESDFDNLYLPINWYYIIKKDGNGKKLKFPIKTKAKLYFRKMFLKIEGRVVLKQRPIERVNFFAATESCSFGDI